MQNQSSTLGTQRPRNLKPTAAEDLTPKEITLKTLAQVKAKLYENAAGSQLVPPLLHNRQVRLAAFCVDDRFLATSDRIGMVRLFETAVGDPITPAFSGGPVRPKRLAVVGERLLSIDTFGNATAWKLPSANTDSTKLLRVTDYLTSRLKISPADLAALKSLPAFKSYLNVTFDQAAQWHLREAEESRAESNEPAAQFHLAAAQKVAPPASPLHAQITERMSALGRP